MNRLMYLALAAMALAQITTTQAAANLLANPGFETDAVFGAEPSPFVTDWSAFNGMSTASADLAPVRSGVGSLWAPGFGAFSVPVAFQNFPANPGEIWDLQGYFLTPETLPADATNALLKIVWNDELGAAIQAGEVLIGTDDGPDFPGVASVPRLNSTSAPNTWHFTQVRAVAPPGTASVDLFAIFVDPTDAGTAYFDDLVGTMITEEPLFGDYNNNDVVDAADYTVWRNNLNTNFVLPNRDPANTGNVSNDDYAVWKKNFGMSQLGGGSVAGTGVPEPTSLLMATVFLSCWGALRRKK